MKKHLLQLSLSTLLYTVLMVFSAKAQITPNNNIIYVTENATGNGSSWGNPASLATALQWAQANRGSNPVLWDANNPLKIYVAVGTYKPSVNPSTNGTVTGRNATFLMVKNVQLYGGFAGTENSLADRDLSITANVSILSGDIDNNDDPDGTIQGDNAYHVVLSAGDVGKALLDGFTITGGNANGSSCTTALYGAIKKQTTAPIIFITAPVRRNMPTV